MAAYFITAIDTGVGKTVLTGLLAKKIAENKKSVITYKPVQTGSGSFSEDIFEHRKLMQIELTDDDVKNQTCRYLFSFPASPHLAAAIHGETISVDAIVEDISRLEEKYEVVLVEGAGGILVPLTENYTIGDFLTEHALPVILVTSARLGSINHTLLSLEYFKSRGINLLGVVYNKFPETDSLIADGTERYLKAYLKKCFPESFWSILTLDKQLLFENEFPNF